MYCHNFHVVLSDGDFFFARSSMSCAWVISHMMMMMIVFITFKSSLVPLFEGLWSSNSWEFELSGFRRNRTDTMSPNLISLFHRDLFYRDVLGDVCFYSDVSRWVTCYVVASPLWHVVIRSLVDYSFVLRIFYFDWKIPCTVFVLWWDYSQLTVVVITVKCGVWHSFQRHQFL